MLKIIITLIFNTFFQNNNNNLTVDSHIITYLFFKYVLKTVYMHRIGPKSCSNGSKKFL